MSDPATGRIDELEADTPYPGVLRRAFHGQGATVTAYEFRPGASFPVHRHEQEQITLIHQGAVRMTIGERELELAAGGWSVIPPGIAHGIIAGEAGARITAIIVPRRQTPHDYQEVDG
jgi:quercetin dioxygenase-like cupin family protein